MDILQIVSDTDRRGAQVFARDLGLALAQRGHRVTTRALVAGDRPNPLDVRPLGTSRLRALLPLRREARDAAVVIAHGSSTLVANAIVRPSTSTPFVYRQISDSRFWASSPQRRIRVAAYLRAASRVVALSTDAASLLSEYLWLPADRVTVIPNGVPATGLDVADEGRRRRARLDLGLDPDRPTLGFVAALVPEKGPDMAVRVLRSCPSAQLLVAGDGPERSRLEHLAANEAPGRVTFLGSVEDVPEVYRACDLVVLPSLGGDSMPATLIEAGLCGLPAVATNVGSIPTITRSGETGIVVDPGDQPALDAAVARLLDDPAERMRLGQAALEHCSRHFEIDVVAGQWEEALGAVVTRRRRETGRSS